MEVRIPNLGEGADSGTVVSIAVKEGQAIKKGQTLIELENEKAVAPIPSPVEGVVARIAVKQGDKVSVGQLILTLKDAGQTAAPPASAPTQSAKPKASPNGPAQREGGAPSKVAGPSAPVIPGLPPPAAPAIRKLAQDLGIDLSRVTGSERGGRIVLADLRQYIEQLQAAAAQVAASQTTAAPAAPAPAPVEMVDFSKWGPVSKRPMSSLRQTIARRMTENASTIPHVTQFDEADITALNDLRKKYSALFEQKGTRLTLTVFALKATARALRKHPIFNASLDEKAQKIIFKEYVHIRLAVDTEAGLIVPVIRDADKKGLLELAREVATLAEKARERKIGLDELKGGSFTISNQGGIGGGHFTPIINKPEVAILGLGRGTTKPVWKDATILPRLVMPLAISYDHRVIDGGHAARFCTDLVKEFEQFPEADLQV